MQDKEENQQVEILNRSMMLLEKQTKSIRKWAKTSQEIQIAKAIDGGIEIGKFNTNDDTAFIAFLGEWKFTIGDLRKVAINGKSNEYLILMAKIKQLYPTLTLPEIKLASELSILEKLDCSAQLFGNQSFSILYITTVINSYLRYKRDQLTDVRERFEKEPPVEDELPDEDKIKDIVDHFKDVYAVYMDLKIIQDPMNICYHFFKRTNRFKLPEFKLTEKDVQEARQFGIDESKKFLTKEDGSIREAFEKLRTNKGNQGDIIDIQKLQDRYSRNYCSISKSIFTLVWSL